MSKQDETAVDVITYAAQIACQLGAHIVKVKPPTDHIELGAALKVYEEEGIPIATLEERIKHVIQSSFNGRRIVIFSGGAAKGTHELLEEIRSLAKGGASGSIVGRNAFQRPRDEAIQLLHQIMDIFSEA